MLVKFKNHKYQITRILSTHNYRAIAVKVIQCNLIRTTPIKSKIMFRTIFYKWNLKLVQMLKAIKVQITNLKLEI